MDDLSEPVILREVLDPESMMDAIRHADLEPLQLDNHRSESRLARVLSPNACLDVSELGPSFLFTGSMPQDCYTMSYPMVFPQLGHSFNFGMDHTAGYLGFFPPGGVIDATAPAGAKVVTLSIPEAEFHSMLKHVSLEVPEAVLECGAGMKVGSIALENLDRAILAIENMVWQPEEVRDWPRIWQHLKNAVIPAFFEALRSGCNHPVPPTSKRLLERYRRLREARDYIAENYGASLTLDDLCEAIGMSKRGTENLFHDLLGITPNTYLRNLRLHQVRKGLIEANPRDELVKKHALESGFWHLGHFAHEYRALFGESPSGTLDAGNAAAG